MDFFRDKTVKAAVCSVFFFGYAVHLYAFANLIPNMDGLSRLYEPQLKGIVFGRFFLPVATLFHGFSESPALIGFLSLVFLALSAALLIDLLQIKTILSAVLTGAFLVISMPLTHTYAFIFTASAYCFGILLAVLSVWLCFRDSRRSRIIGAVCLALSVGVYQSYLALAAALSLVVILVRALPVKEALRALYMLIAGLVLYYILMRCALMVTGTSLLSYRGLDGGGLSTASFLANILPAYTEFFTYLFLPGRFAYITAFTCICNLALALITLYALYRTKRLSACGITALLLMPLAVNCLRLAGDVSEHMRYAYVAVYLLAVASAERCLFTGKEASSRLRITQSIFMVLAACVLLGTAAMSNRIYTALDVTHRATLSFATTLVARVQATPGYTADKEVVIIGTPASEEYTAGIAAFAAISSPQTPADTLFGGYKHVYYYVNDWLHVTWQEPSEERLSAIEEMPAFASMPLYPDDGSVRLIDGAVVVKLADKHIPKEAYEIDYENAFP